MNLHIALGLLYGLGVFSIIIGILVLRKADSLLREAQEIHFGARIEDLAARQAGRRRKGGDS